jgi:predicted membrane-bound mannosyltransferase
VTERVLSPRETFSPSAAARPARRDRTVPFLLGIVALGAALRLFRLGARPLGGDEGFSWMWTHLPHPALWGAAARFEYNPPLFYSLQRLWLAFGDSEAALRSLPALLGVLLLPLVFWIGRATSGGRTGLLAALLAATSAPLVAYSQEARMYSFLCLVALPPISSATRPITVVGRRAVAGRPGGGGCRA